MHSFHQENAKYKKIFTITALIIILIFLLLAGIALEKGTCRVTDVVARSPASRPYKGVAVEKCDELVAVNGTHVCGCFVCYVFVGPRERCVTAVCVCVLGVCCVCTLPYARGIRTP